jgi:small subunit ribosomal protein S5
MENQRLLEEKLLKLRRTSIKRAGGSSFHYSALCVVGDNDGNVGLAIAKSKENVRAINKAKDRARRNMKKVLLTEAKSIPHEVYVKFGAAKILLRPAPEGSGIIAGGSIRQILELAGVRNISAKIIGSNNQVTSAYALMKAFTMLRDVPKKDVTRGEKTGSS